MPDASLLGSAHHQSRTLRQERFEGDECFCSLAFIGKPLEIIQGNGLLFAELGHGRAAQSREMRRNTEPAAGIVRERPHVGAPGALHRESRFLPFQGQQFKGVDLYFHRLQFHRLLAAGERISAFAVNPLGRKRRRHLRDAARQLLEQALQRFPFGLALDGPGGGLPPVAS